MKDDAIILRALAYEYAGICNSERNADTIKLHRAVNDLRQVRPVVLIDELPWSEMNMDGELTLQCTDPYLRGIEDFMRKTVYQNKYMPADMIVQPYVPIRKIVHSTGIGISVEEEVLSTNKANHIVSHQYHDILKTEEDLAKLKMPEITYDRQATEQHYQVVGEILGDILPVKLSGVQFLVVMTWDNIARYRGVTNLLTDLVERPAFMHKVVRRLTDIQLSYLEQIEDLGLLDNDPYTLHCTPVHTSKLSSKNFDGTKITRKDIWGRGAAQIFASVSPAMHDEFDIEYMKETVGQCGLVYYGCCEPLDKKMDIVEKIPNLRKVSITPWADVDIAAEAIGDKYVLSAKPNPSAVAVSKLDREQLQKELTTILEAAKRNNCSCDIVLKDISTCGSRPENIFEWEKVAMELVRNY